VPGHSNPATALRSLRPEAGDVYIARGSAEDPVIEFEDAGFSYGGAAVLRDMSLSLEPGSFHFLTGVSGAGKSTFIRLCYMDLLPTRGRIRFAGRRIAPRNRKAIADLRRNIGIVQQNSTFLEHLPLIDNIALPLQLSGIDMDVRTEDLQALLEWVELADRADVLPRELSSGERQRAALARAVILSPDVILADEPAGSVDWDMALRILALLVELNRMGKTVLVATHDKSLVRAALARVNAGVLKLSRGRIALEGGDP
jgi:cell division transport system ATP-binding protein